MRVSTRDDATWMKLALAEARRGRGWVEPNPMVGSVLVRDGQLISTGHHERYGGPHAELRAIEAAGAQAAGADLYVTLEPCCHHGKTPPCTQAILRAGIARVVAAMPDPFPAVSGRGFEQLRAAGVAVESGLCRAEAEALNAAYLTLVRESRPHVTAKWAMTLDGKLACASGDSKWISGERSRAMVHEQRGQADAILVGIGTAIADDPHLTARPAGPRTALRIVLDRQARLPLSSRLVRTSREAPVLVVVTDQAQEVRRHALEAHGCEVLRLPTESESMIRGLLAELGRRRLTHLIVEGGGRILGAFFDAGLVDAVDVFIAPAIEGGAASTGAVLGRGQTLMSGAWRLQRREVELLDGDIRVRGVVRREEGHAGKTPGPC